MFLLLDRASAGHDREMAEHITYVHRFKKHPEKAYEALPAEFLRAYITMAKRVSRF
jgi:DNA replication licensing factor MCM7